MKRFLTLFLLVTFVFMISNCSLAEGIRPNLDIDPINLESWSNYVAAVLSGLTNLDNWYTIEEKPLSASFMLVDGLTVNGNYMWNDQTYGKFNIEYDGDCYFSGSASYLSNFGLFAGLSVFSDSYGFNMLISPGYRLNLGKNGYAALRVDVAPMEAEIIDYLISGKYLTDKLSLKGKLTIFPADEEDPTEVLYSLGANYKIVDSTVVGLAVVGIYDENAFELGLTWKGIPNLTFDGNLGKDINDYFYYNLSGMYRLFAGFSAGAHYDSIGMTMLKTKYSFKNSELGLITSLPIGENGFLAFNLIYKANL